MKFKILYFIFLFFLAISCRKEHEKSTLDYGSYYLGDNIDCFNFKVGSYWIYENN
jgi:hypothetical protein